MNSSYCLEVPYFAKLAIRLSFAFVLLSLLFVIAAVWRINLFDWQNITIPPEVSQLVIRVTHDDDDDDDDYDDNDDNEPCPPLRRHVSASASQLSLVLELLIFYVSGQWLSIIKFSRTRRNVCYR